MSPRKATCYSCVIYMISDPSSYASMLTSITLFLCVFLQNGLELEKFLSWLCPRSLPSLELVIGTLGLVKELSALVTLGQFVQVCQPGAETLQEEYTVENKAVSYWLTDRKAG